jgi:hypothetical protein
MRLLFQSIVIIALSQMSHAQELVSKNGHIWFYSHTPVEDIEAHNRQVVSILDLSNGDIAFNLLIKSFEFRIALMQEHFNENYMESDKFPKATYKGKITNLDKINFKKEGIYPAEVSGDLTIHNVTKPVKSKGAIEVKGSSATARAKFIVIPQDFDITIPSVVENKIAKEITVNVDITYSSN